MNHRISVKDKHISDDWFHLQQHSINKGVLMRRKIISDSHLKNTALMEMLSETMCEPL